MSIEIRTKQLTNQIAVFHIHVGRLLSPVHNIRLGERCDRKCIQNDLDARRNVRVRWNRNYFYSSVRDARPDHFVCTSGRNATQANTLRSPKHIL